MTAPAARRSTRKQPSSANVVSRKPTTRSGTMPQPSGQDHAASGAEEDEEEEEINGTEQDEEHDEEESSDGESVTRCLCGEQHNVGLMVQCDKCEVWQHCDCVGLTEEEMPDLYYCDHCQPDNHILYKSHGRYKRAYNPNGSKKNSTMTESNQVHTKSTPEKQSSEEPVGRAAKRRKRSSQESNKNNRRNKTTKRQETESSSPTATRTQKGDQGRCQTSSGSSEESNDKMNWHEDDSMEENNVGEEDQAATPAGSGRTSRFCRRSGGDAHQMLLSPLPDETPSSPASRSTRKSTRSGSRRNQGSNGGAHSNNSDKRHQNGKHHTRNSPRSSTPQMFPEDNSGASSTRSYWGEDGQPIRESSPPAKVKYPNPKMSIADMNKRAKQIFDYINKLQVNLAPNKPSGTDHEKPNESRKRRERADSVSSTSSSLSSASTLPLPEDHPELHTNGATKQPSCYGLSEVSSPTTPVPIGSLNSKPPEQETASEIMSRVTRELIKFQRKFGTLPQSGGNSFVAPNSTIKAGVVKVTSTTVQNRITIASSKK